MSIWQKTSAFRAVIWFDWNDISLYCDVSNMAVRHSHTNTTGTSSVREQIGFLIAIDATSIWTEQTRNTARILAVPIEFFVEIFISETNIERWNRQSRAPTKYFC